MSDFGLFEADEVAQDEPRRQARTAARQLDAAINVVRRDFGRFLMGATGIDEFGDRWHYSKHDIRAAVEPHVFPATGTMRRIQNAMKQDWKLAHRVAMDHDEAGFGSMPTGDSRRNQDLDETYHPSSGNLIPEGDFEGYKDSVDQDGPEKVSDHDFTPGGDSGSDRRAAKTEWKKVNNDGYPAGADGGNMTKAERDAYNAEEDKKHGLDREAARLVADIYTDFARANGLRVASLDTLDLYATTGLHDADYRLLQSMIIRTAEDCSEECDDDEDTESEDSDSETDSEAPSASEGDDSEDSAEDEDSEDSEDSEDYGFGDDTDADGDHDDADHHGGEQYTIPDEAPELPPEMMQEIPQDDASGSAPVPPEVIDSLLGLPEGTIEQLLLEEVEQGQGGDPGMSGPPMGGDEGFGGPPPGDPGQGAPQGGGDDFFGGGGDDTEQEPPRVARRRRASARRFWAAEGDEQPAEGGEGGGEQQTAPAQDPAAAMGQMMPPPGSQAVQPPQPPMPIEDQPAEDALLDTANQAIMQMIDRETQEYQQIIDPLSQALQAIQFAQQVEQAEHPMDVTPPEGTVDVSPAAAPGGAQSMPQQPMQQQAMRRQAKIETALRGAAALIASRYRLSGTGHRMLVEATLGRRGYEHVVEALRLVPPESRKAPAIHMSHLFAAGNQRFNPDVFLRTVMAGTSKDRYENKSYTGPRDKRRDEHGEQDMDDWDDGDDEGRTASRGRLPFDLPRRTAGETWTHTPTMDAFEFPNAGEVPEVTDNMTINDLPKMKGAAAKPSDALSRFKRWVDWKQQQGVPVPGGEGGIHNFMQTRNPVKPKVGPRASGELHRSEGLNPDLVAPKVKVPKAVNPVLRKPKGPAKAPAAPKAASRRTAASFFFGDPPDDDGPKPSDLHCSRCGHTAPGDSDAADPLCPRCPGAVMDYQFYGHDTGRLADEFRQNPESDYGDALFEELEHRGSMGDEHALETVKNEVTERGPRGNSKAIDDDDEWVDHALDAVRHPSNWGRTPEGPADSIPAQDYQLPAEADPRRNRALQSSRQGSFFTRRVPGWKWDDHLSGYLSKEARAFTCACGERVAAPSYKTCSCGRIWNVYAIGDTHHLASDTAEVYIAREIEVRPGVIMANKKMAGEDEDWHSRAERDDWLNRLRQDRPLRRQPDDSQDDVEQDGYFARTIRPNWQQVHSEMHGDPPMDLYRMHGPREDGLQAVLHSQPGGGWSASWFGGDKSFHATPEEAMEYIDGGGMPTHDMFGGTKNHMANRKTAKSDGGCDCWDGYCRVPGTEPCAEGSCRKCDAGRTKKGRLTALQHLAVLRSLAGDGMSYEDAMRHIDDVLNEGEGHTLHHVPGTTVPGDIRTESYDFMDCPHCRGNGAEGAGLCPTCDGSGAVGTNADSECEACLAVFPGEDLEYISSGDQVCPDCADEISGPVCQSCGERESDGHHPGYPCTGAGVVANRREADWTKYDDDVDPVAKTYGKPKPPSTKIPSQPKDWAGREFTGPNKGQWREPEGTELPRNKRKKK